MVLIARGHVVLVKALLMANLEAERISVFLIISAKARPEDEWQ